MPYVMIVDDVIDSCEALAKFLERAGYRVRCVPNGREALADIIRDTPDVVILDLMMPVMDGPTLLEILRLYLRLQTLPVVVLTGIPDSPLVERVRNAGVSSILVKGKATFQDIERAVREAAHRLPS
jgi:CheY-like chemotaxis protein